MNPQIEQSMNRIADGARGSVRGLINNARRTGQRAAAKVVGGKKPVRTLAGLGLKLSAVSHRTTDRVVKQQTAMTVNQLDVVAARLQSAAGATCLRDLVKKQISMTPEQFQRFTTDARKSVAILVDAGSEAREVVKGAVQDLRAKQPKPRKKAARKAPAKKARKTAARKTAAAKPAAKKVAKKRAKTVSRKVAKKA